MTKFKHSTEQLFRDLRVFALARKEVLAGGGNDNTGAIHSVERYVNLLGLRLKYPGLTHIRMYRFLPGAECSRAAYAAFKRGEPILIEHATPHRALARKVGDMIAAGASDAKVADHIRRNYRLAYLTTEETLKLNRQNRSRIDPHRLDGFVFVVAKAAPKVTVLRSKI
jgi:hypothetical protein